MIKHGKIHLYNTVSHRVQLCKNKPETLSYTDSLLSVLHFKQLRIMVLVS